jgi:integrase/ribosomal protein L40E
MLCRKCKTDLPGSANFCLNCGQKVNSPKQKTKSRGNGQGTVYKLPNGKYQAEVTICYYIENGKVHRKKKTKVFERKKDAIEFLPKLKDYEKEKKITLFELNEIYLSTKAYDKLSKSQKDKLGYAWKRLEPLHSSNIVTLTIDDMQSVIDRTVSTYYPARDMKVMLSHLYDIAIKREFVQYNKTEYIELPELKKSKRDAWHEDEIETLWNSYNNGNDFIGYILIMIYAGLRFGELAKIRKEDIHLDEKYAIGGIKTEAGIDREIAFADKIMPIVTNFYNKGKDKLLEMNESTFYDKYHNCTQELGIRDLPPHCCRHTYFTRLASEGVQPAVITESGGHKDLSTTMQYIHIPLSDKLKAVNKI